MIEQVKELYIQSQRKRALANIGECLSFFMLDIGNLPADEIEQAVVVNCQRWVQAGITTEEAIEATKTFSRIMASHTGERKL